VVNSHKQCEEVKARLRPVQVMSGGRQYGVTHPNVRSVRVCFWQRPSSEQDEEVLCGVLGIEIVKWVSIEWGQ